jgi:hypothetical protein
MTAITMTSTYLSTIDRLVQQNPAGAKSNTAEKSILDSIHQTSPEKADALEKRLEDAKQVDAQLRAVGQTMSQSKKASAAEKVKRIKDQIKMLKMMGGDPKIIARQIAQLARELSSASKEYAEGAGGSAPSQDNTASANIEANAVDGNNTSSAVAQSSVTKNLVETSTSVSATALSSDTARSHGTADNAADATSTVLTEPTRDTIAESSRQYEETTRQKQNDDLQNKIGEIRQKSSEATDNREFVEEVRRLAAQLKALANQQKLRLHQIGEQTVNQDFNKTNQALAETEKNVSSIATGSMTATITINTFV